MKKNKINSIKFENLNFISLIIKQNLTKKLHIEDFYIIRKYLNPRNLRKYSLKKQ